MSNVRDKASERFKAADERLCAARKELAEAEERVRQATEVLDKLNLEERDRAEGRTSMEDVQQFIASERAGRGGK